MENNSPKNNSIHLLYKKLGETPNQCLTRFKMANPEYFSVPLTYAGRLDPVAEGLLLVLSGDETREKDKYLELKKTYEFEMLWGFSTDTLDILGVSSSSEISVPTTIEIKKSLESQVRKFEQVYPAYSSKPVLGKPLFMWTREGKLSEIEIPKHEVETYEVSHLSRRTILGNDLLNDIKQKIKLVVGDFRQKEILNKWVEALVNNLEKEYVIDKMSISVSGGFYVRQFVSDLANSFDAKAVTYHIKRTKVGDFDVEDCI